MATNYTRVPLEWEVSLNTSSRFKISEANDFFRESYIKADENAVVQGYDIPYCFDFVNKELICSRNLDAKEASNSIFHYDFLRENTKTILTIPWEHAKKFDDEVKNPIFIFSPGRCGSTLFANFFRSNNTTCLSEPDIYSQAVMESIKNISPHKLNEIHFALNFASKKLIFPLIIDGKDVIIKLRLEAIYNPSLLTSNLLNPKTFFIIRNFSDWAASILRVFTSEISLDQIGSIYNKSLLCYSWLLKNTNCMLIKYEELNAYNELLFKNISSFLDKEEPYKNVQCFSENSQKGTYIHQIKKEYIAPEKIKEINYWWLKNAPVDLIKSVKLDYLLA
jgi:hypothetical protein